MLTVRTIGQTDQLRSLALGMVSGYFALAKAEKRAGSELAGAPPDELRPGDAGKYINCPAEGASILLVSKGPAR